MYNERYQKGIKKIQEFTVLHTEENPLIMYPEFGVISGFFIG